MEPNKILSASMLDLVFDGRNKDYGAYELRVTYPERIKRSMIVVFIVAAVTITGVALASNSNPKDTDRFKKTEMTIQQIKDEDDVKPPPPPPPPKPIQPPPRTIAFTTPVMTTEDVPPPPDQEDIRAAQVDTKTQDGPEDIGLAKTSDIDDNKDIVVKKAFNPDEIQPIVQVEAKYDGDWVKFLTRNLNAEVPVDNGAPAGRYNILVQFVVDRQGNLSDIVALTNYGFGMEEEAIRVLKKAKGWKPGIQNGYEVKSYRKQPITFVVE